MEKSTSMADNKLRSLIISSYICRGFNSITSRYIENLLSTCHIIFIQEHWLGDAQLGTLANISAGVTVAGFDNSDVLTGCPNGGCAILWQSNLLVNVSHTDVNSRRICAAHVCFESVKLLFMNVYMP
jgi:hypothetical protein